MVNVTQPSSHAAPNASTTLSERDSKALLASFDVPIAAERFVHDATEAGEAADQIGYPVVAKLNGDAIAHKTERGLVRLRLGDRVSRRARRCRAARGGNARRR